MGDRHQGGWPSWLPPPPLPMGTPAVALCHGFLTTTRAKTTHGLIRHGRLLQLSAVVDRQAAGQDALRLLGIDPAKASGATGSTLPVVESIPDEADVIVVGVAPAGGALPADWKEELSQVLRRGGTIISGMHAPLLEDADLAAAAAAGSGTVWDVRAAPTDLPLAVGHQPWPVPVVLAVATDAAAGKRTAAVELFLAAERAGHRPAFVASGQTGIMLGLGAGIAADHLVADFLSGAFESLVAAAVDSGADLVIVEGQGALSHPAYGTVSAGLILGVDPTHLVMTHPLGRSGRISFDGLAVPSPTEELARLRALTDAQCLGLSLTPDHVGGERPRPDWDESTDGPVTDVVAQGADALVQRLPL